MDAKKLFPFLEWLPNYKRDDLRADVSAGLTVGIMLIPQGMAYAMLAGMPPIYGLYAAILPLVIYAILGTSRQLSVGPVAMVSLLVASGVGQLAPVGSTDFLSLAVMLAVMVGTFQILLGTLHLGFMVNFLSHPVISGFTSAAAIIIGVSQFKYLLGIEIPRSHHVYETVWHLFEGMSQLNWITVVLGGGSMALMLFIKRWNKAIPGALVAVVCTTLLVWGFNLTSYGVQIVGFIPEGLPSVSMSAVGWEQMRDLLPLAVTISLISFIESIAISKAIQAKHKNYTIRSNQELIAIGFSNWGAALFQGFPVAGSLSRTAVSNEAGARTGVASLTSAILLLGTLLFLTPLFYFLPKAILAAIILMAVVNLIDVQEARKLWHTDRRDFATLVVTFAVTLALGIEQGLIAGVVLSMALVIYQATRPSMPILGRIPETEHYQDYNYFPNLEFRQELLIFRFDASLYFANSAFFKTQLEAYIEEQNPKVVVMDAQSINAIDSSAVHVLVDLIKDCQKKGITFYFAHVKESVYEILYKHKIVHLVGLERFFLSIQEAVDFYDQKQDQERGIYMLQE